MGLRVDVWSSSSVVTEGVVSGGAVGTGAGAGAGACGRSSTNTRVAFGAVLSQGKMGLDFSDAGGVVGTW